ERAQSSRCPSASLWSSDLCQLGLPARQLVSLAARAGADMLAVSARLLAVWGASNRRRDRAGQSCMTIGRFNHGLSLQLVHVSANSGDREKMAQPPFNVIAATGNPDGPLAAVRELQLAAMRARWATVILRDDAPGLPDRR